MAPNLSYITTEREHESSMNTCNARINKWEVASSNASSAAVLLPMRWYKQHRTPMNKRNKARQ